MDSSSSSPSALATPLPFLEGDAELALVTAHLIETCYGRTLLSLFRISTDDDCAAAAARIMGALLQPRASDGHCLDTAHAIIDCVHGRAVVADAFDDGPLLFFPVSNEHESGDRESKDSDWERKLLRYVSEARILDMAEMGREIVAQWGVPGLSLKNGESAGEETKREEDEEHRRFELGKAIYLRAREGDTAGNNELVDGEITNKDGELR